MNTGSSVVSAGLRLDGKCLHLLSKSPALENLHLTGEDVSTQLLLRCGLNCAELPPPLKQGQGRRWMFSSQSLPTWCVRDRNVL